MPYAVDAAFLRKLGMKPGMRVALIGAPEAFAEMFTTLHEAERFHLQDWALRPFESLRAGVAQDARFGHFDMALVWMRDDWDLEAAFRVLQGMVQPKGAVWTVIPKKKHQGKGYPAVSFETVQAAGLTTDLVNIKDLSFSEAEYGLRWVVRKERRAALQRE